MAPVLKKSLPLLLVLVLMTLALVATTTYRQVNQGNRLYHQYFSAESPLGYQTTRAVGKASDQEASIWEQAKRYHQGKDYQLALSSLRNYFESEPAPNTFLPELLAGTAAMASGEYTEARRFFQEIPADNQEVDAAALWYLSLLDLKQENLQAAQGKLELLTSNPAGKAYPAEELLERVKQ